MSNTKKLPSTEHTNPEESLKDKFKRVDDEGKLNVLLELIRDYPGIASKTRIAKKIGVPKSTLSRKLKLFQKQHPELF